MPSKLSALSCRDPEAGGCLVRRYTLQCLVRRYTLQRSLLHESRESERKGGEVNRRGR
jgi:hypothetical protein